MKLKQSIVNRNIWLLRTRMGVTIKEGAELIGIPYHVYRSLEYQNKTPKAREFIKICRFYQINGYDKMEMFLNTLIL